MKRNAPGSEVTVYYDPHEPAVSQIGRPSRNQGHPNLLIGIGGNFLLLAVWGLCFPKYALGTVWISTTLALAAGLAVGFAELISYDARGKDSIGHGIILLFGTPMVFMATIVISGVIYAIYRIGTLKAKLRHLEAKTQVDRQLGAGEHTDG